MRLPAPEGPTYIVRRPMTSSMGCTVASASRSPPTMKNTSPLSACGDEPSIGVSRWATPRSRAAALIFCEVSGVTVEQSQVTSPGREPASPPAAPLDELLEALEVALDADLHDAERVGDVLDGALRIVVDLEHHACAVVVDPVKGHRARVPCAAAARPRDALVGALLDDLGVPFLFLAADDRAPVQALVVELMNFLHALHEARKLLELRPLVVDRPKRCIDLDGLLDSRHDEPLLNIRSGW